jgi:cysteine desulfurase / selenocysteine lyase
MKIDQKLIRTEFPQAHRWTYLNTAANGIIPERSRQYLERYFRDNHYLELAPHYEIFDDLQELRDLSARLFGGGTRNWSLQPNTSFGINIAATAIDWRSGDNVVVPDCEFPANVFPWLNLRSRGVEVRLVPCPDLKARAGDIMAACDKRTRAIAISGVQYHNGYQPDLAAIGEFCREQDIMFCLDGIQGLGNRHWNLETLGVDFMAAGAQKWLGGPRGSGLLFVSNRVLDRLAENKLNFGFMGWLGMADWQFENLMDFGLPQTTDARILDVGTYPFHDIIAMKISLEIFAEVGIGKIASHCDRLRDRLLASLSDAGLIAPRGDCSDTGADAQVTTPGKSFNYTGTNAGPAIPYAPFRHTGSGDPPDRQSQILALACDDSAGLKADLLARGIATSAREGALRVGFHLFNREDDVNRLAEALAELRV